MYTMLSNTELLHTEELREGLDRLLMILEKKDSIRDVMAYPKTGSGEDYLFNAPNVLSAKKVSEANVQLIEEAK